MKNDSVNVQMSKEQYKWQVSLDVAHFSPSEISLSVSDGFLEVGGKHEERPDEHGFIARCFTRKYRLPAEIDVSKIASTLSVDGILTVEAPVPETSVPAVIIIPIKTLKAKSTQTKTCPNSKNTKSQTWMKRSR
uniref:Si:dkey-1k23.3 n=1 Tax=Labrus bergylta TaxID=56723 RepID=A0A3Q3ETN4_9LABR